ncbi:MAG TPA: 2-C-methyl-D-erythritol 4-phosphate cytidylyltransferase [Acholeplasmatales bacterium]|nr:2-C-methyl-D-erythritol 4-phosphate cytidylyltransferase [Acholeplasmatales bacterium]
MYSALIVAAGGGTRMHLSYNKIFCEIRGKAMLLYSVDAFRADPEFDEIVIVHAPNEATEVKKLLGDRDVRLVPGGASRQESVRNGLEAINNPIVFIHDAARPNLRQADLDKLKAHLTDAPALVLGVKSKDTLKTVENGVISGSVDREKTYSIQTPQVFPTERIRLAHALCAGAPIPYTDDTTVYTAGLGEPVTLVEGDYGNIKVTTMSDLVLLEDIL